MKRYLSQTGIGTQLQHLLAVLLNLSEFCLCEKHQHENLKYSSLKLFIACSFLLFTLSAQMVTSKQDLILSYFSSSHVLYIESKIISFTCFLSVLLQHKFRRTDYICIVYCCLPTAQSNDWHKVGANKHLLTDLIIPPNQKGSWED